MNTPKSSLRAIYQDMLTKARALPGEDQIHQLSKGARIALRLRDGIQTVTFSRMYVEVGAIELGTFVSHCSIPPQAKRIPAEGQGKRNEGGRFRYYVAYQWQPEPLAQSALPLELDPIADDADLFPEVPQ